MIKSFGKIILITPFIIIINTVFAGEVSQCHHVIYLDQPSTLYYPDQSKISLYNNAFESYLKKNKLNQIQPNEPFVLMYQWDNKKIFMIPKPCAFPYSILINKKKGDIIKIDKYGQSPQFILTIQDNHIPFKLALNKLTEQFEALDDYPRNLLSLNLNERETSSDRLLYLLAAGILTKQKKEDGTIHYIHGPNSYVVNKKEVAAKLLEEKEKVVLNRVIANITRYTELVTITYLISLQRR